MRAQAAKILTEAGLPLHEETGEEHCGAWCFKHTEEETNSFQQEGGFNHQSWVCGLMMQHWQKKYMCCVVRADWKEFLCHVRSKKVMFGLPRHRKAICKTQDEDDDEVQNNASEKGEPARHDTQMMDGWSKH